MTFSAAGDRCRPSAAIRPWAIATSLRSPGLPLPSMIVPPRIRISQLTLALRALPIISCGVGNATGATAEEPRPNRSSNQMGTYAERLRYVPFLELRDLRAQLGSQEGIRPATNRLGVRRAQTPARACTHRNRRLSHHLVCLQSIQCGRRCKSGRWHRLTRLGHTPDRTPAAQRTRASENGVTPTSGAD